MQTAMAQLSTSIDAVRGIRLEGLDALRAIAAIMVLLHHEMPALAELDMVPKGYLAVDFFFMLSGFVVSLAHEKRIIEGMHPTIFLRARLVRLYPVMALGIAAGAAVAPAHGMAAGEVGCRVLAQAVFVPLASATGGLYVLNGVQWSLTCELVANAVHGVFLARLKQRELAMFVAGCFVLLLATAHRFGSLAVGDRDMTIAGAIPRVLFSYGTGMLLFRMFADGRLPAIRLSPTGTIAILAATPIAAGVAERVVAGWWLEPVIVATVFPVLIAAGAHLRLKPEAAELARFGGRLSYPVYALHLPMIGAVQLLPIESPVVALALGVTATLSIAAFAARLLEPGVLTAQRTPRFSSSSSTRNAKSSGSKGFFT